MSDKVQYEPVPHDELQDYQKFHINKEKSSEIDPSVGGVTAEVLGIPAIAGAKSLKSILGSNITKHAINWAENKLAPKGTVPPVEPPSSVPAKPIPSTVGAFHAPEMVTPYGFGPGAVINAEHNVDQKGANPLHANIAANPERGFELKGNSRILTPEGTYPSAPSGAPFAGSAPPPEPPPLTAGQRALQTVKNIPGTEMASKVMNNPLVRGAGNVGALWQGGEDAMRLWNHLGKDFGRSAMDTASLASNIATIAPTPASPWSNIAGAAASIPLGYYQRKWDAEDKAKREAGGLETLR